MKLYLLALLLSPFTIFGQFHSAALKIGHFNPSAINGGFIIGYEGGRHMDKNFSFGWSVDWFHKNYTDQELIGEFSDYYGMPSGTINQINAQTSLHDIPVLLNITGNFDIIPGLDFFVTGGLGGEVLLIFYEDYQNPEGDDFQAAFDFSWRAGIGAAVTLGKRTDLIAELIYHSSRPSAEYKLEDINYNTSRVLRRTFDMSGVIARMGVRFYF